MDWASSERQQCLQAYDRARAATNVFDMVKNGGDKVGIFLEVKFLRGVLFIFGQPDSVRQDQAIMITIL